MQVVDMDGRIDALSKMVDRLLEAGAGAGGGADAKPTAIPRLENWAKRRRLDGELSGVAGMRSAVGEEAATAGEGATGLQQVKMENGRQSGASLETGNDAEGGTGEPGRVKAELTEEPEYKFSSQVESLPGDVGRDDVGVESDDGMIIGGGLLCRGTSFIRNLDNMSIGSVSSLDLIDLTSSGGDVGADQIPGQDVASNALNDSLFDVIDFEAEITSMSEGPEVSSSSSVVGNHDVITSHDNSALLEATTTVTELQNTVADTSTVAVAAPAGSTVMASVSSTPADIATNLMTTDQTAKIQELTACLDSMPPESRRKLAEGLLALAQNPPMGSPFTVTASSNTKPVALGASAAAAPAATSVVTATGTPEIALPLASAALGAFMLQNASAFMNREQAVVAAIKMDSSRHAIKRTTSLR